VARLAALLRNHQPHRGHHTRRGRAPRTRRRRAGHRRPQRPGTRALPLRPLSRQRRLDRARRARAQHAALDAAARTSRHNRPRRPHPAPPTAPGPRPPDPARPRLDAAPPGPLAMARRLHPRAGPHPRTPRSALKRNVPTTHQHARHARPGHDHRCPQHPISSLPGRRRPPHGDHNAARSPSTTDTRSPTTRRRLSADLSPTDRWIRAKPPTALRASCQARPPRSDARARR
jgi:hypothetical protein